MKKFVFVFIALVMLFTSCGKTLPDAETAGNTESVDTEVQTEKETVSVPDDGTFAIDAGDVTIRYPEMWEDEVDYEVTDGKVSFSANGEKLFDILFNSEEGDLIGTLNDGKGTTVSVVNYTSDSADDSYFAMQEDLNVIIDDLRRDYGFTSSDGEVSELYDIDTSVVTLKFPAKWKDSVIVSEQDGVVSFSTNDGAKLFDIAFNVEGQSKLGVYKDTVMYLNVYEASTDEEFAIQEDVNVILTELEKDDNFTRTGNSN